MIRTCFSEVKVRRKPKSTIKGCLIGLEKARLDFGTRIDPDMIPELTRLSNEFITGSHEIRNTPPEQEPEALFWICEQIKMPCGGSNVKNRSEISPEILKRKSQGEKLDRLHISCDDVES